MAKKIVTVKELIDALKTAPQDAAVVVSSDTEGNSFSHLLGIDTKSVYKDNRYGDVEIGIARLDKEALQMGLGPGDVMTDGKPCVIFVPR